MNFAFPCMEPSLQHPFTGGVSKFPGHQEALHTLWYKLVFCFFPVTLIFSSFEFCGIFLMLSGLKTDYGNGQPGSSCHAP